jgi:predicted nuclease with TOPRIM domain
MTNDELERAIDFLLKNQANADARIARTDEQLARIAERHEQLAESLVRLSASHEQLAARLDSFADTQAGIMRVMTQTLAAQDEINNSLRATVRDLASEQKAGDDALRRSMKESDDALRRSMKEGDDALRESMRKMADAVASLARKVDEMADARRRGDNL